MKRWRSVTSSSFLYDEFTSLSTTQIVEWKPQKKNRETATHRVVEKYAITNHYPRLSVFECAVPDDARLVAWRTTEQAILQQVAHLTPLVADVH